jgi:hypothetical protein
MSVRTHFKLIGAAGAAALAIGTVAGPAVAAGEYTATSTYTCLGGLTTATVHLAVDTPSTTTLVAGQKLAVPAVATVTLPPGATHLLLTTLGWDHFSGNVVAPTPTNTLGMNLTVPLTAVGTPDGTDFTPTTATATGNALLRYPTAGTKTFQAGNFTGNLTGFKNGSQVGTAPTAVPCVAPTDGSTILKDSLAAPLSITVTKDTSKTVAKASYNARRDIATGIAKVTAGHFGLKATGKVAFVLKRGTHKVAAATAKLNKKGIATVHIKGVKRPGKYTFFEKYSGNGGLKSSTAKVSFRVS